MRFLHTADWHINKHLQDYSLLEQQAEMIKQIKALIQTGNYDALLIAGDLFDTTTVSNKALQLVNQTFKDLIEQYQVGILVIAGNHDNPVLLDYGSHFLASQGLYSVGESTPQVKQVIIKNCCFTMLPFLSLQQANQLYQSTFRSFQELVSYQISTIELSQTMKNVLLFHGYVVNENQIHTSEESERPLAIGTLQEVSASLFSHFDYVALGHLHKAMKITDNIRYSGSLYKYSKSEANYKIQVWDVDLEQQKIISIPLTLQKDVRIISGTLQELLQSTSDDYVFIELTDKNYQLNAMQQLLVKYPYAMNLQYSNLQMHHNPLSPLSNYQPQQLGNYFMEFYHHIFQQPLTPYQKQILNQMGVKYED